MFALLGIRSSVIRELSAALADPLAAIQQEVSACLWQTIRLTILESFIDDMVMPRSMLNTRFRDPIWNWIFLKALTTNLAKSPSKGTRLFSRLSLKDYMIGTTRARYSQFQKQLPFVESDLMTGTTLVQSFYVSQGFPQVQIVKLATLPDNRTRSSQCDRHH